MPLLEYECECGPYEVLTTIAHDFRCPKCGKVGKRVFVPPRLPDTVYTNVEDQKSKDRFARRVQKHAEDHAEDIRAGRMDIQGSNPVGFEPDLGKRVF